DFTYLDKKEVLGNLEKIKNLAEIAGQRGQKLSQMAISWLLNRPHVSSVLIGASSTNQLKENVGALEQLQFTDEELNLIDKNS
ncbi:MAG: L-glyceraldehyde 3-phosphate reductase, partial [Maribacter sp.]|nr:L-glyceraldehyde 3-phosphate reductase [Maribacter sp.]